MNTPRPSHPSRVSIGRLLAALTAFALAPVLASSSGTAQDVVRVQPEGAGAVALSYAATVRKVVPAVVNIYARRVVREQASPFANDPFFQQFFGSQPFFGVPRERVQNSLGSGVMVRSEGIVVTNNHVIAGAEEITVALSDRREFQAQVVLADPRTDLAVLRIDPKGEKMPAVTLRNSDDVEVGDIVLAIGNPFGVGQTVTSGIVSALARTQVGVSDYQFFIQTDAAINPGNSGGALVTTDGGLIGINSAIFSQSGGSIGIGFAIPANMVRLVVQAALSGGTVSRPWLGAQGQAVTADIAQALGLDRPGGVLLNQVAPDGPAAKAGLAVGDVIIAVDGFDVIDPQALHYRITTKPVGGTAKIDYRRNGQKAVATLALVKAPETVPRDVSKIAGQNPFSGATLGNLSPAFAEELGTETTTGVVVVDVDPNSIAGQLRLKPGDILVSIEGEEVRRVADVKRLVAERRRQWRLSVRRHDQMLNVIVPG